MIDSAAQSNKYVRPSHPPLTHFPIAAYVLAAGFDAVSEAGGSGHRWAGQSWHAGTFVLTSWAVIFLATMLTGLADLVRFNEQRRAATRTIAIHVSIQAGAFMLGVTDVAIRLGESHRASNPPVVLLPITAAVTVCTGGSFGGTLVYRHGTGVGVTAPASPAAATGLGAQLQRALSRTRGGSVARGSRPVSRHRVRDR